MIAVTIIQWWQYDITLRLIVPLINSITVPLTKYAVCIIKVKTELILHKCFICVCIHLFANQRLLEIAPNICCIGPSGGLVIICPLMKETHMRKADSLRLRDVQAAVATGAIPTSLKITMSA